MQTDIATLRDSFWLGYDSYYTSRVEAARIWDMYHNRQWSTDELAVLKKRGQPEETFNVVKLFARMLVGYYSTVINTVRAAPQQEGDEVVAALLTDTINNIFDRNRMGVEGDKVKLSGMISGMMCAYVEPYFTGKRDQFQRPIYDIRISYVPDYELVRDPASTREDYEDARFLHRFKWVTEEDIVKAYGEDKRDKLDAYFNHLNVEEAEFYYKYDSLGFSGRYKVFDNYLVVHTVIVDNDGKRWSIHWCGDVELDREEITYRDVKWNYRIVNLHTSDKCEYYGIFREVAETQLAINQALVKLQLMVNSQKAFVEDGSVANLADFTTAFNRVTGVIPVKKLAGIKVENIAREALELFSIIDKAFDRIQRLLSVNDSFLGMAYASDSGRKVKLQQNATVMALRYLTVRIEAFYELLGGDVAKLVRQFFTANQVLRVSDEVLGDRYIELNKPMQVWNGKFDEMGQPAYEPVFEQVYNPDNGKPQETESGDLVFAPIPEDGTEFKFTDFDIRIDSVAFSDEDERAQLLVENVLAGNIGQMLAQVNPAGFFKAAGLVIKTTKTKYSPELADILASTGQMLMQQPVMEQGAATLAGGLTQTNSPKSRDLKLPTNTNERA